MYFLTLEFKRSFVLTRVKQEGTNFSSVSNRLDEIISQISLIEKAHNNTFLSPNLNNWTSFKIIG